MKSGGQNIKKLSRDIHMNLKIQLQEKLEQLKIKVMGGLWGWFQI
jgi:hypothetical protein